MNTARLAYFEALEAADPRRFVLLSPISYCGTTNMQARCHINRILCKQRFPRIFRQVLCDHEILISSSILLQSLQDVGAGRPLSVLQLLPTSLGAVPTELPAGLQLD